VFTVCVPDRKPGSNVLLQTLLTVAAC